MFAVSLILINYLSFSINESLMTVFHSWFDTPKNFLIYFLPPVLVMTLLMTIKNKSDQEKEFKHSKF